MLDDGIHTLAYFHKDSVTSYENIKKDCDKKDCKEIKKDCDKKDCDNWKRLKYLKKNLITEKHCDKKNSILEDESSSNVNEFVRAVFFYLQKDFTCTKYTKSTKSKKITKTQPSKCTKRKISE